MLNWMNIIRLKPEANVRLCPLNPKLIVFCLFVFFFLLYLVFVALFVCGRDIFVFFDYNLNLMTCLDFVSRFSSDHSTDRIPKIWIPIPNSNRLKIKPWRHVADVILFLFFFSMLFCNLICIYEQ